MVDDNGNVDDSTSNNNDGTKVSAGNPVEATGKVGQAQDFSSDYISLGVDTFSESDFASGLTFELIFNLDVLNTERVLVDIEGRLYLGVHSDNILRFEFYDGTTNRAVCNDAINTATFYYLAGTWDTNNMRIYLDGAVQTDTATSNIGIIDVVSRLSMIGNKYNELAPFDGIIDEVRISSIGRSAEWTKGTHNSLWDTLFTYGSEETEAIEVNAIFMGCNF